ncbi:MAG: nucleoside deaminase [Anaerolineaceae bacterium]|nr:nucleoside deaminase [Anaerolineaceae bacterium]
METISMWSDLSVPWRAALSEAWKAYLDGCIPIGAAVADGENVVIASGRCQNEDVELNGNMIQDHKLAHAQMNVLLQVKGDRKQLKSSALYCTCEPCPMCMGALYMSGIRDVFYAQADPYSGSSNLLGITPYLSVKPVRAFGPFNSDLEGVLMAMNVEYALRSSEFEYSEMVDTWREFNPRAVSFGEFLRSDETLLKYKQNEIESQVVFEQLILLFKEFAI